MAWTLSCPDWAARIEAGQSLIPDLPLFRAESDLAAAFYDALRLPDVPGTPLLRDASGIWFRDLVRTLFGARDPVTNLRHIREIFALVPKGNSKTTYGAAMMITALFMNRRPRAEFLLVGPTQAISDLAFDQAAGMVRLDPDLARAFKVTEHIKEIEDLRPLDDAGGNVPNGSVLKVKTFDANILTGTRPLGVLLDELHLLGRHHATGKVLRQLRGGLEKSTEGFLTIITTQSDEPPAGAFRDELMMARAIRDGRQDGRMLPILYEFPEAIARDKDLWSDPACWPMVMPNLGLSLRLESLLADWRSERAKGEAAIRIWASQHLNIEIGVGLKSDRWAGADYWEDNADPALTFEEILRRSDVVVAGLDGGGLDDLYGFGIVGRDRVTLDWLVWSHAWCHADVLKRRPAIAQHLTDFATDGDLSLVTDLRTAETEIVARIEQVVDAGLFGGVGVDAEGPLGEFVDLLAGIGVTQDNKGIFAVRQGIAMMGALKTAERRLASATLRHDGCRLLSWNVENIKIEPTATAIRATKQNAGDKKIDVAMAVFNGIAVMITGPEPRNTRELQLFFA